MADDSDLRCTVRDDGSASVVIQRPGSRNALDVDLLRSLRDTVRGLQTDPAVSSLTLSGAGDGFCSGMDRNLYERCSQSAEAILEGEMAEFLDVGGEAMQAILDFPGVTIALVHNFAIGGGLLLAAACDFRFVVEETRFSLPEHRYGIPVTWGGLERMQEIIGRDQTLDLAISARQFMADEAYRMGIASRVGTRASMEALVQEYTDHARQSGELIRRFTKPQLRSLASRPRPTAAAETAGAIAMLLQRDATS